MIGYLEGKLLRKEEDRILLLTNQIGYEVLLPAVVMKSLLHKSVGEDISLYIFFQVTQLKILGSLPIYRVRSVSSERLWMPFELIYSIHFV